METRARHASVPDLLVRRYRKSEANEGTGRGLHTRRQGCTWIPIARMARADLVNDALGSEHYKLDRRPNFYGQPIERSNYEGL